MPKICSRCKEEKELNQFSRDKYHTSGYKSACKKCASASFITWRQINLKQSRERERISHYVSKYKLTLEEAMSLVLDRTGICSICGSLSPLVIDHCHTSNTVRGRICSSCNSLLGYAKDNIKTLANAIHYLENFYGSS